MRSTIEELTKELNELRALAASIAPVNDALAGHQDSVVRQYLTIRRRFDYAAFVVALYASFEKFAENLVAEHARLSSLRQQYASLPEALTRKHIFKSADILARGRIGEGRYSGLRELDVVKNLFDCLSGATGYALNEVAIVAHDLNLRYEELGKLFAAIGIEQACERAGRADAMVKWFCALQNLDQAPAGGIPAATIKQRLDDLVERRNQVAHRGGSPLDLLGPAEMAVGIDFVAALAASLFATSVATYLDAKYVEAAQVKALVLREGPYKDGTVIVVDRPPQRLYVGQAAFAFTEEAGVRWGRVIELQLSDASVPAVETSSTATDVGVCVNFRCTKNARTFVLDADDDLVWEPLAASPIAPPPSDAVNIAQ